MRHTVIICTDTTTGDALAYYLESRRLWEHRERRRQQRRWYFIKQRLNGIFLIVLTMILIKLLDGDATIALITVPLGLYLAFTKKMCIVNEFYWQTKERRHNGDIEGSRNNGIL